MSESQVDSLLVANGYDTDQQSVRWALADMATAFAVRQYQAAADSLRARRELVLAVAQRDSLSNMVWRMAREAPRERSALAETWEAIDQWVFSLVTLIVTGLGLNISF